METPVQRSWLCLAVLVFFALDVGVTLLGQEAAYWAGNRARAIEANPLAYRLLAVHPGAFLLAAAGWAVMLVGMLQWLPSRLATACAFIVTVCHAVGVATWMVRHGAIGWLATVVVFLAAKWLLDRACPCG